MTKVWVPVVYISATHAQVSALMSYNFASKLAGASCARILAPGSPDGADLSIQTCMTRKDLLFSDLNEFRGKIYL